MMSKRFLVITLALVALAYVAGRYGAPVGMKSQRETEISKDLVISELNRQLKSRSVQTVSVTTTLQTPDGTIRTQTRTSSKDDSIESVIQATEMKERVVEKVIEKKVIEMSRGVVISALAGMPLSDWSKGAVFGASFSKPIIGPVHIGAFAFTDLRVGVSLGLEF